MYCKIQNIYQIFMFSLCFPLPKKSSIPIHTIIIFQFFPHIKHFSHLNSFHSFTWISVSKKILYPFSCSLPDHPMQFFYSFPIQFILPFKPSTISKKNKYICFFYIFFSYSISSHFSLSPNPKKQKHFE